ncbi:anti-sigma B factor RsbW [Gorillibacterium timonense]|uniref:anti-sigma B factor RsbW n=1 Tax=Gorillibacterium timonense TaxID=1689269 RepID=UPI00071D115F|nr:anti-sigma B factor RsbW [Gorillibacterium timonense]
MMVGQKRIFLSLPAEAECIDIARLALYGISNQMGFSYEDIEDMKVAIAEACNNVVLHAYAGAEQGTIDIEFLRSEAELTITVSDSGESFPYDRAAHTEMPYEGKSLDDISAGGLGIYLMQALMDRVEVEQEAGTKVMLTKYLTPVPT